MKSTVQPQVKSFVVKISNDLKIFILFTNYNMFKLLTSNIEWWHEMKNSSKCMACLGEVCFWVFSLARVRNEWVFGPKMPQNYYIFGQEIPLYECVFYISNMRDIYVISLKQYFFFLEYQYNCNHCKYNDFVFFILLIKSNRLSEWYND